MYDFFRQMGPTDKVMVFFGKKTRVDDVASDLALQGVNCQSIHGGREQADREQALDDLKTGIVQILLATDVASRGIDIEDVTYVNESSVSPHNLNIFINCSTTNIFLGMY